MDFKLVSWSEKFSLWPPDGDSDQIMTSLFYSSALWLMLQRLNTSSCATHKWPVRLNQIINIKPFTFHDIFVLAILIYRFYFYKTKTNKQNNPPNFKCTHLRKTKILIRAFIKSPAFVTVCLPGWNEFSYFQLNKKKRKEKRKRRINKKTQSWLTIVQSKNKKKHQVTVSGCV